ncbi:uncharacterized protein HD556DRAFT_1434810 [Suillus plorans]|uniref:C2H2-type domain-containing protein n=1 Tax=Suillus plorans TaxID=116603 RepID=A0A9P7DBK8_9AGAM|nr:uncharacterized protein HD556DRAFT_1434810 [Suillus plorans]KAG1786219.1 hypothetical protein HD556DRAFT_1434810 [Suillus plorans]
MAPAVTRLVCRFPNCNRVFKNKSGLTQHTHARHSTPQIQNLNRTALLAGPGFIPPRSRSPTPAGVINENFYQDPVGDQDFVPEEGTWVDMGRLFHTFHPHLTGLKCDANGAFIDQDAPPPPHTDALPTDWTPYDNRAEFEMAEFLFTRNQMSAKQIDTLLDLWAATLIKHNDAPPFANHRDMYATIDATPLGDTPWKSFTLCYNGAKPEQDIPPWMDGQYDVWYRDPLEMTRSILANCAFDGGIEYSPYRDYTTEDKQYWKNFMSGDWAWKQADDIARNEENCGSTFVPLIIGSDKTVVSVATATKEHNDDIKYRNFRQQLFQRSLAKIFESVKPFMENFDVTRFLDGHYRRTVYGLGPYIADYPEQILLSGVVQNWCPRSHTELLIKQLTYKQAWDEYGIIADLVPFTNDFPRADVHELLSPDILHQIIKGTFKDHLVDWVGEYLLITHGTCRAAEIMDDIDRRIAAVAPFAGLRRFPDGRGFWQWTGDDSKALMKVYLAAIEGHVPQDVVRTFSAFLEFCYTVRREALTEDDLVKLQDALDRFHQYRGIFKTTGVVSTFSLPRQHSLCHYILLIRLFGAPNGLCSSITESKHIKAVKEPWRRSSRFDALGQMLLTNQHLDKLAAAHVDFEACGMLHGSCLSNALGELQRFPCWACINSPYVNRFAPGPFLTMNSLELDLPRLPFMIQEFIHNQHYSKDPNPPEFDPATAQVFLGNLTIFNSAAASFHAPSDLSGTGGMRREHIQATPSWRVGELRHDFLCFFSFNYRISYYPCAIVHWYSYVRKEHDPDTGMYVVTPATTGDDVPDVSIIHINCIFRAAHLIPVYGPDFIPKISPHNSYDMFDSYYVNRYADHHAFEIA